MTTIREISVNEAKSLVEQGAAFIDVRSPAEWNALHAQGTTNIPLDQVNADSVNQQALKMGGTKTAVIICQKGGRSLRACQSISSSSQECTCELLSVSGGTEAWDQAGFAVHRNETKTTISMERQVRIIAGLVVFLFSFFSLSIHVAFSVIPLLVGAGLMFSGITDWCGLAILLSKAPWNQ